MTARKGYKQGFDFARPSTDRCRIVSLELGNGFSEDCITRKATDYARSEQLQYGDIIDCLREGQRRGRWYLVGLDGPLALSVYWLDGAPIENPPLFYEKCLMRVEVRLDREAHYDIIVKAAGGRLLKKDYTVMYDTSVTSFYFREDLYLYWVLDANTPDGFFEPPDQLEI